MTAFLDVEGHVTYALRNAAVRKWPFPHFFAENVFPEDFYRGLVAGVAARTDYKAGEKHYNGRTFADAEGVDCLAFMQGPEFMRQVATVFAPWFQERFNGKECEFQPETRFVRDGAGYRIGPHTDARWKVVSLLFYLPEDTFYEAHGTSVYVPKNAGFVCPGGPHYEFEDFKRVYTAPYVPNACFGFFKTDNSFHGVELVDTSVRRDVLLYNIYAVKAQLQDRNEPVEDAP